jgi:hypothetical protein
VGLPAVVASGMPAGASGHTGLSLFPLDYMLRMTFGPWALAGHLVLWCTWAGLVAAVGLMVYVVRRSRTTQRGLPPSLTLNK